MFVEVWNTSPVQGYAYLVNENTGQVQEYGLNPPSGTQLVGNSAEWVVERPGVGGGLANLTNYIQDYFANCFAYNFTRKPSFGPGSKSNATLTNYKITMDDNGGHPISYPTLLGPNGIWFQDAGSKTLVPRRRVGPLSCLPSGAERFLSAGVKWPSSGGRRLCVSPAPSVTDGAFLWPPFAFQ